MQPTATEHDSQSYTSLSAGVGCSFFPLIIEGQLAELSAFVVSKNGSKLTGILFNWMQNFLSCFEPCGLLGSTNGLNVCSQKGERIKFQI